MAKIQDVDYKAIPAKVKNMREAGKALNREMTNAYKSVADMHNSWHGKRYSDLAQEFNKIIPDINEMLKLVVQDIPYALETIANNYSQADTGSKATSVSNESASKIANLSIPNDVGMKCLTDKVEQSRSQISKNFQNAKSQMDKFEAAFKQIKWESEAASIFKQKFTNLKNKMTSSFENIERQFTKLIQQAQQDIEKAEKANTLN